MAPSVERFSARLAARSHAELLEFAARGCHESADIRRDADAELAIRTPVPDWAVNQVLLSPDLVPHIFASLELEDHAAAAVCKAWRVGWKALVARRALRPAPCPTPDFELRHPWALAALPGERMAIATQFPERVHIVDKEMKRQRKIGVTFGAVRALAAGNHGLYVSDASVDLLARLRRFKLDDTFTIAAERTSDVGYTSDGYCGFYHLALAPGGVLFALPQRLDCFHELLALDALSLEVRFTVGEDVLGGGGL